MKNSISVINRLIETVKSVPTPISFRMIAKPRHQTSHFLGDWMQSILAHTLNGHRN